LTGRKVDDPFTLIPPSYSAYGLDHVPSDGVGAGAPW